MSATRESPAFQRVLRIVHEGLRGAQENADEVRKAADKLEVGFMDVVAIAVATEIVKELESGTRIALLTRAPDFG